MPLMNGGRIGGSTIAGGSNTSMGPAGGFLTPVGFPLTGNTSPPPAGNTGVVGGAIDHRQDIADRLQGGGMRPNAPSVPSPTGGAGGYPAGSNAEKLYIVKRDAGAQMGQQLSAEDTAIMNRMMKDSLVPLGAFISFVQTAQANAQVKAAAAAAAKAALTAQMAAAAQAAAAAVEEAKRKAAAASGGSGFPGTTTSLPTAQPPIAKVITSNPPSTQNGTVQPNFPGARDTDIVKGAIKLDSSQGSLAVSSAASSSNTMLYLGAAAVAAFLFFRK